MYSINIECDLEDEEFMAVDSTALQAAALLTISAASYSDAISKRVAP
jgi:hypothetical protein